MNGGQPGARSHKVLERADGTREILPAKCDRIRVRPGDALRFITWGGGGWGDPLERDAALVTADIRQGLVSVAGAARYGVLLSADGSSDVTATEALRTRLRRERGATALFDFGADIATLRARCLDETGLAPPRAPVPA